MKERTKYLCLTPVRRRRYRFSRSSSRCGQVIWALYQHLINNGTTQQPVQKK
jgi:hypothetical protein